MLVRTDRNRCLHSKLKLGFLYVLRRHSLFSCLRHFLRLEPSFMATPVYLQFAVSDRANLNTYFYLALSAFYSYSFDRDTHDYFFSCVFAQTLTGATHNHVFF